MNFLKNVVWPAVIAATCAAIAVVIAAISDDATNAVIALVGSGIVAALLSPNE